MNTGSVLAQFTITLSLAVNEPVSVEWFTSDGTAKAGVDYAANRGTVVFAPGQVAKTVDILVYGRAVGTEDRSFYVEMLPPTNAILGAPIGECIIHVDTTGSQPVTEIIIPTGPRGIQGKSAYQTWLDLGNTGTEQDFINSLKPNAEDIAEDVLPLLNVGDAAITSDGTGGLSKPDATTVKALARRVAYASAARISTVVLANGDNTLSPSNLTGATIDFLASGFVPRVLHNNVFSEPTWEIDATGKLVIKGATAGDVLYAVQYDTVSTKYPLARRAEVVKLSDRLDARINEFSSDAAGKGDFLLAVKQSLTGAVTRTQHDKNKESVSVFDFGAKGDGVADDSVAFQAAVNALIAVGGGTINVPDGWDYLFLSTVTVPGSGIRICGGSPTAGGVRIINGTTNSPALMFGDGVNFYNRNSIEGVCFAQAQGVAPSDSNCGLLVIKNNNFRINNVEFFEYPDKLFNGIVFNNCGATFVSNVGVQGCRHTGIKIENYCVDIYFSNVRSDANQLYGFNIIDSEGLYFSNATAWGNFVNAWRMESIGGTGCQNLFFSNCVGDTSGQYNWVIMQLRTSIFTNCWGSAQKSRDENAFASGFLLEGDSVNDIRFNNCGAFACNNHGFDINHATDISLIGCMAGGNYKAGVGNGNATAGHGVYIGPAASKIRISNGSARGNSGYGVRVESGASDVIIRDFDVTGNSAGSANIEANTTTKMVDCAGYSPKLGDAITPAIAASSVGVPNPNPYDCMVYISGGSVTQILVGGAYILPTSNVSVLVPAGSFINIVYSTAPVWKWIGL